MSGIYVPGQERYDVKVIPLRGGKWETFTALKPDPTPYGFFFKDVEIEKETMANLFVPIAYGLISWQKIEDD